MRWSGSPLLEEGRWYKWPFPNGVCLVERISESSASIRFITDEVVEKNFDTADGDHVNFKTKKTGRTNIAPRTGLEPATEEEVAQFTSLATPPRERKQKKKVRKPTAVARDVTLAPTPDKECSYTCTAPATHRLWWLYETRKTFRVACDKHATNFARSHGLNIPKEEVTA